MATDTKTIGGKRYTFLYYRHTKAEAQRAAKKERAAGWSIRIFRHQIGRALYFDLYGRR